MSIIIVLTNWDQLGDTGNKTGWYLPEVAHPYEVFTDNGYKVEFISPKGGATPMDPGSKEMFKEDPVCKKFLANTVAMAATQNTKSPKDIKPSDYKCIFYAGGHGPMFDMPNDEPMAQLCADLYQDGRIVSAVCHGTVGLLNVKLGNGQNLIKGHELTSFTDAEEHAVNLMAAMPFALETKLKENGAKFKGVANFENNVVVSGQVITGQNPASATETAKAIVKQLQDNRKLNAL